MIELPPNQPGAKTAPASELSASAMAKQRVSEAIQAIVVKVQAQRSSGAEQKPLYDILLQTKLANGGELPKQPLSGFNASSAINQLTAANIQALQNGQSLLVKTQAQFPLELGSKVLASLSLANGIVIKTIIPPSQAQTALQSQTQATLAALKLLVPQQQGLNNLLSNLQLLLAPKASPLQSLPLQSQQDIKQLAQIIPKLADLRQSETLQKAINNSGIFLESKIKDVASQLIQQSNTNNSNNLYNNTASPRNAAQTPLNIGEALKLVAQRISQKNEVNAAKPTPLPQPIQQQTQQQSIAETLSKVMNQDFKQALNQIRISLEQSAGVQTTKAENANPNNPINATNTITNTANKQDAVATLKTALADAIAGKPLPAETVATKKQASPIHNAIKHYQTGTPLTAKSAQPTATEQLLLPPLPGQITVQAQARPQPNVKANDMADALVSILLKQVKGALARITLHQLASQPQRQEAGASPQVLSFEVPFMLNNQAQVIQFRIEEELAQESGAEQKMEKRWVVQMGFDIEGLGPMLCQIALIKHSASVSFWAEWENTLSHTKAHFDLLEAALTDMGLKVEKIQGHLGIPEADQTLLSNQLVDIKT